MPTLMSHQEGGKGAPPGSFVLSAALWQQRAFAQRPTQRAFVSARVSDSVSPLPAKPWAAGPPSPAGAALLNRVDCLTTSSRPLCDLVGLMDKKTLCAQPGLELGCHGCPGVCALLCNAQCCRAAAALGLEQVYV